MSLTGAERQARYMQRLKDAAKAPRVSVSDGPKICAFCSKNADQVSTMVQGHHALICNECIALCSDIVADKEKMEQARAAEVVSDALSVTTPQPVTDAARGAPAIEWMRFESTSLSCEGEGWDGRVGSTPAYSVTPRGTEFEATRPGGNPNAIAWHLIGRFPTATAARRACEAHLAETTVTDGTEIERVIYAEAVR